MTSAEPQTRQRERYAGRPASSLTPSDLDRARAAGYEPSGTDDWLIGRDPRDMTQDELRAMGHQPMSLLAIIRAKCLDCVGGSPHEVRACVAMACPNWPVRMNKNPWRAPPSEAQREAGRRNAARMRAGASDPVSLTGASAETDSEVG